MIANYNLAVLESISLLKDYNYNEVPIDLNIVLKALKRTVRKCSFSKFSADRNLTIDEICEYFESDLGACAYDKKTERYIIYYNDTKSNEGLDRFTIAHELGHIFLKHHLRANTDIMLRKGISNSVYKVFENEANCFARNLLTPYPLVNLVTDITKDYSIIDMMEAFQITHDAAIARRSLFKNDGYRIKPLHREFFKNFRIRYGYYCLNCKSAEVGSSKYCKICGEEHTIFEKGVDRVFYDGLELDKNMKLKVCPKCLNSSISEKEDNCNICGQYLYNDCSNESCGVTKLSGNTRCCPECGCITTLVCSGHLKNWEDSLEFQLNKLDFEENLCGKSGKVKNIDDWSFLGFELGNDGKEYVSKLLEHTTAKLCGNTLLIYAPKALIKDRLEKQNILEIIMDNLEPELGISANNIEVACLEDFYPIHNVPDTEETNYSDIPF